MSAVAELVEQVVQKVEPKRVKEAGIYPELTPADYHADPAPGPSLSASVACTLITETPFHAWMKHPRLTAEWRGEDDADEPEVSNGRAALGSVAHELLLGRGHGIRIIQAPNYTTKAARQERDAAIAAGHVPCLAHELDRAQEIVDQIRDGLARIPGCHGAFNGDGLGAEVAGVWREPELDVWGRILVDWWGPTRGEIWDLKTTSVGLSDEALMRKIANEHIDLRCAWYERGVSRLCPDVAGRVKVNLVFVEAKPPHEVRVVQLGRGSMMAGHKKVAYALSLWSRCLHAGSWPGYPREIMRLDLPTYAERQWTEREEYDEDVASAIAADPFVSCIPTSERAAPQQLSEYRV